MKCQKGLSICRLQVMSENFLLKSYLLFLRRNCCTQKQNKFSADNIPRNLFCIWYHSWWILPYRGDLLQSFWGSGCNGQRIQTLLLCPSCQTFLAQAAASGHKLPWCVPCTFYSLDEPTISWNSSSFQMMEMYTINHLLIITKWSKLLFQCEDPPSPPFFHVVIFSYWFIIWNSCRCLH